MIYNEQKTLHNTLQSLENQGKTIGLIPTMGTLHAGHSSLVKETKEESNVVVVSIFVNPIQFSDPTNLEKYPRTLQADAQLLHGFSPEILVYAPSAADVYGDEAAVQHFDFGTLDKVMEGPSRPSHFDGAGTIIKKLFEIVTPDRAYFGEKDYQQLLIIERMATQTGLPVTVVPCPVVRNAGDLALSSHNALLSKAIHQRTTFIYRALQQARERFATHSSAEVTDWVMQVFANEPDFELEYFTITDAHTLQSTTDKGASKDYRAFIVAYAEGVRLIDNISVN